MKSKLLFLIMMFCTLCISTEICADETMAEKLKGSWYICYPDSSYLSEYQFKDDGTVDWYHIDGYGELSTSDTLYTYVVGENTITFSSIGLDGSADHFYWIDVGEYAIEFIDDTMHLVYSYSDTETIEWYLYTTAEQAIEYSDTYKYSDEYISSSADENGFVIEDGVLKGYFGVEMQVTIPDNVHTIGTYAFMNTDLRAINVKEVIVPGTVKKLESSAFAYSNVETVYLEEGVEEIGNSCFANSYLSDLYIPESVTAIAANMIDCMNNYDEIVIHCVEKSFLLDDYMKKSYMDDSMLVTDYEKFNKTTEDSIRPVSVILIVLSVVCIIGMLGFAIIRKVRLR